MFECSFPANVNNNIFIVNGDFAVKISESKKKLGHFVLTARSLAVLVNHEKAGRKPESKL